MFNKCLTIKHVNILTNVYFIRNAIRKIQMHVCHEFQINNICTCIALSFHLNKHISVKGEA